ncbi:hypothetical protein AAC387_Pa02g3427 [Persea americana]
MSMPLEQQSQQPPPVVASQQLYSSRSGSGSVGPVIVVLVVITILGIIAGLIGRLCTGRSLMGHGQFDFEGWIERKCSSCIDGRIDPPTHRANGSGAESVHIAMHVENPQEAERAEDSKLKAPATAAEDS